MATKMMAGTPGDDISQPAGDQAEDGSADESQGGYVIEIHVGGDGSIKIGVESEDDESAEEGGEGGESDDDQYQSVASPREALKVVSEILRSDGQMPDNAGAQQAMAAGYGE